MGLKLASNLRQMRRRAAARQRWSGCPTSARSSGDPLKDALAIVRALPAVAAPALPAGRAVRSAAGRRRRPAARNVLLARCSRAGWLLLNFPLLIALGPRRDGARPAAAAGGAVRDLGRPDRRWPGAGSQRARESARTPTWTATDDLRRRWSSAPRSPTCCCCSPSPPTATGAPRSGRSVIGNAWIYALSLAVYCTAWTYFGSVGRAAASGRLVPADLPRADAGDAAGLDRACAR